MADGEGAFFFFPWMENDAWGQAVRTAEVRRQRESGLRPITPHRNSPRLQLPGQRWRSLWTPRVPCKSHIPLTLRPLGPRRPYIVALSEV